MDTDHYKTKLEARLQELVARTEDIEERFENSADAPFDGDSGQIRKLDVLDDLDDLSASEARSIHAALDRVEDGTYGDCVTCGDAIDGKRLDAVPHTPFCRHHA